MLRGILEKSQKLNFLGNPPIDDHIRNAMGFAQVIHGFAGENQEGKVYDLGSGGGVPALVLIEELKEWEFVLICLLYTSPSPRDRQKSRMPSSA